MFGVGDRSETGWDGSLEVRDGALVELISYEMPQRSSEPALSHRAACPDEIEDEIRASHRQSFARMEGSTRIGDSPSRLRCGRTCQLRGLDAEASSAIKSRSLFISGSGPDGPARANHWRRCDGIWPTRRPMAAESGLLPKLPQRLHPNRPRAVVPPAPSAPRGRAELLSS